MRLRCSSINEYYRFKMTVSYHSVIASLPGTLPEPLPSSRKAQHGASVLFLSLLLRCPRHLASRSSNSAVRTRPGCLMLRYRLVPITALALPDSRPLRQPGSRLPPQSCTSLPYSVDAFISAARYVSLTTINLMPEAAFLLLSPTRSRNATDVSSKVPSPAFSFRQVCCRR